MHAYTYRQLAVVFLPLGSSCYPYIQDLMSLTRDAGPRTIDHCLSIVSSPAMWLKKLKKHPDQDFVKYIISGITNGFHIGVNDSCTFKSAKQNMLSARQNPAKVDNYIASEKAKGNVLGPFPTSTAPQVHISRIGVIPKKLQPGQWRLITDLSHPEGASINDAINPKLCSLSYITVNEVAERAVQLGRGSLIAKIDIKSAYRLVPVHPCDCHWLGICWNSNAFVDAMLPFGLRSAPKIFTAIPDAFEWCVSQEGVAYVFHYLDDFAVLGSPSSPECAEALNTLQKVAGELGILLAEDKQDGPTSEIVFLGIMIDTVCQELRLPEDKLKKLMETVEQWGAKKN